MATLHAHLKKALHNRHRAELEHLERARRAAALERAREETAAAAAAAARMTPNPAQPKPQGGT